MAITPKKGVVIDDRDAMIIMTVIVSVIVLIMTLIVPVIMLIEHIFTNID